MNRKLKSTAWHYIILLIGSSILSFGMYNIHSQSRITEGGVLGAILFLQHWFGISPSVSGFIMDMSCYFLGWRFLGGGFLKSAIMASASFSLTYRIWESRRPVIPDLSAYPLAAAILGGIFVGVGVGLVVREGGAAGGDDALAMLISRFSGCNISKAYLFTDITVLTLSLSYIPFKNIFFSFITVTISSFLIGQIQKSKKTANI